ncbi:MAG: glycosyltransferase family 2 protein [Cyanobacteriota bacterium]|jgi:glycosyltransferase involved in cell wall biosynthesis
MSAPTLQDYQTQLSQRGSLVQGGKKPLPVGTVDQPLITLITVVFNAEKTLEKTIQSVLSQNYPALEYIVIDGASRDQTLTVIQTYEDQITYWRSESDQGIYDAMNKGIALSHGQIIGLLNAGDYLEPETLNLLAKHWQKSGLSGILTGNCRILMANSSHSYLESGAPSRLPAFMIPHASVFVSRPVYECLGLFDRRFSVASDFDFLCRCYQRQIPFEFIDEVLTAVSPRGFSSNYYHTEWDYLRIRLRYRFLHPLSSLGLSLWSFVTITLHYLLDFVGVWPWIEERRYGRAG